MLTFSSFCVQEDIVILLWTDMQLSVVCRCLWLCCTLAFCRAYLWTSSSLTGQGTGIT